MNEIKKYTCYVFVLACFYSCRNDKAYMELKCLTPDTVLFSKHIVPIFNTHCNISGCHSGAYPTGKLNLEASLAYSQLMKSGSGYIDTVNSSYSLLYAQMNSASNPMPPTGKLDKCTLDLVLKWIQHKARNN